MTPQFVSVEQPLTVRQTSSQLSPKFATLHGCAIAGGCGGGGPGGGVGGCVAGHMPSSVIVHTPARAAKPSSNFCDHGNVVLTGQLKLPLGMRVVGPQTADVDGLG